MFRQPVFAGLVVDEFDKPVESALIGDEPFYVVDDAGFRRHVASEQVDRQVLGQIADSMKGSEAFLSEQTAKMLGQEDIFSKAMIDNQIKNIDQQFKQLIQTGIPEDLRTYLGMTGFRIVINVHGEVIRVEQPGIASDEGEE